MIINITHYLLIFIFFTIGLQAEDTIAYMVSLGDDPIGKNEIFVLEGNMGLFDLRAIKPANSNQIKGFSVVFLSGKDRSWQMKFMIPAKEQIVIGKHYRSAETYPYQPLERAGIKVCSLDRDYNDLRGEFEVLDYMLDSKSNILSLAIDFKAGTRRKRSPAWIDPPQLYCSSQNRFYGTT